MEEDFFEFQAVVLNKRSIQSVELYVQMKFFGKQELITKINYGGKESFERRKTILRKEEAEEMWKAERSIIYELLGISTIDTTRHGSFKRPTIHFWWRVRMSLLWAFWFMALLSLMKYLGLLAYFQTKI